MWENLPLLGDHKDDEQQTPQQAAQPSLYITRDINPDTRAKALQLAPTFNLPVETVEAELPKFEQEAAFQSFTLEKYVDSPVTMRGLTQPQEAPLYRDDADNLSAWEKLVQDISRASAAGKRTVEQKDIWWRKYAGTATAEDDTRDKQLDAASRVDSARPKNYDGWVTGIPKAIVEMAPLWLDSVARSADETAMGASIGAAATSWSGAGVAPGAGAGLMAGMAWGTIKEMTEAETALAYKEFSQLKDASGKPVDDAAARGAAALVGVANGAVEAFGGKVLAKTTPIGRIVGMFGRERIVDLMKIPSARKAFAAVGRTLGVGSAVGGFEEAWQEANNVIIGEQMAAAFNSSIAPLVLTSNEQAVDRIGEAGKMGAQAGVAFAAPQASMGAMLDASTSRALSRNATLVQEIAGLVEGSKTFQRMPQKWQEHIAAIKEEYGVSHDVTVPLQVMQTYFQEAGITADQLAKELPGTAASLAQAAKTGQDVAIPVEEFATHFSRSQNFQVHIPDVRMHQQLPTDREAAEVRQHMKEMVQNVPVKSQPVFEDIRAKVAAAESPAVADFQAAVHYAFYQTQADALGVPVEDFYKQYQVDIERQGITGPSTADLVSMIQADAVPTDADVFGPSLQEFVGQYGDSATTREEAIKRGYFDTTDPAEISEAQWAEAMADTDPRYAYGAADLTKLDVKRRVSALESWAEQMGVDLKHKIKNRRGIDSDQDITISKMLADLKNSDEAGAILDGMGNEASVVGGFASTAPEWFKSKTVKAFDKKYGKNYSPHITKKNVLGAWDKKNAGQELNQGESAAWEYIKLVADDEMLTDVAIVQEITFNSLEKEGFVFEAPEMVPVGNIPPGSEIIVMGDNGVPDKLVHAGFNEKGETILQGIKTVFADPWDSIEVIARKVPADAQGIADLLENGYQQGEQDPRGFITMNRARDYFKITLTGRADLSTFLHESGHMFLEMLNQLSSQQNAPERIVTDMLAVRQWLGMKPGEEFTREHHETWARGFEAYLMEGKAPSAELKSAFARFKAWLTAVYKDIKALNVPLTDEVRGVMDRMFASQEAINRTAEIDRLTPIFGADKMEMTDEEYGEYMLAFSTGMAEAEEGLFSRLVREITAHKQAQHKDATRQIRAEVTKDVEGRPVYQAIHYLTTGKLMDGTVPPGGILGKLDRAAIKRRFPDVKFGGMLGRVSAKDGADPSMVAHFFGFKTGDEIIKAIADAPKMSDAIKAETQERFKAIFGDSMADPGAIAKQAREALHNDRIGDMVVKELHVLNKMIKRVVPTGYVRAMQIFADEQIAATDIGKLQPYVFQVAEQRYARAAFDAAAKNDWLAAADAKRLQLMNHWLFRKATAAREEVDGIRNYLRKFERVETRKKLGLAGGHYLESVDALLSGVGLTNVSAKQIGRRNSLRAYLERMEAEGQTVAIPDSLREEAFLKNYKSMNVEEFRALRDAVKNLDHLARLKNKLQAGAEERDFRATMSEIVNGITDRATKIRAMQKQNPTIWEAGAAKLRSIDAQLSKVEFLVRQLDGGIAGKLHEILFAPIAAAQAAKFDMIKEFNRKLYDPLRKLPKEQKARLAAEYDFLGVKMRGHEVLAVALNMGNESNLKKLIGGYEERGYTEERLQKAVDGILTAEDWRLVQHIWDQVNSLWPEIARVQKAATGLEPQKVEPRKIVSKHGIFDGGYYPIFYDKNRNYKAMVDAQKSNSLFENNYMSPKVGHGFTVERTAYVGPLMLSLDGLPRHINDVVHFLTHYDAVTQALKVISDQDFRVAVSQTVGAEYYGELKPWLQAVANEGKSDLLADFTDRFANHVSTGMSIMTMGFALSTGLIQILGLTSTLSELGPRYLVHGLRGMLDPEARKLAFEKSNELRHTIQTFDRDARAAYSQMLAMISGDVAGKAKYAHAQMVNFAFAVMGYVQREVNIATWVGAYAKADAEGSENPAMVADSTMRLTQSGGGIKDMARIQRMDKPMRRLFTAFYTYFSVLYGQLKAAGQRLPSEPWVAMAQLATLVLLPPLIEQLVKRGLPDDDDDPEKWFKAYLAGVASFGIATLPIVRDFVQAAIGERSYGFTPVAQIIENGLTAAKAAATGDDLSQSQIKALARAFGIATHLPANQIIKTATYFDALLDGEVEEPIREFLFGKVKK